MVAVMLPLIEVSESVMMLPNKLCLYFPEEVRPSHPHTESLQLGVNHASKVYDHSVYSVRRHVLPVIFLQQRDSQSSRFPLR